MYLYIANDFCCYRGGIRVREGTGLVEWVGLRGFKVSCPVFMWVRGFECARAVRSLVCMLCFVLECGVRIMSWLMSWVSVRVWVWTLALHVLSCCVNVWSRVRSAVCSPVHVSCGLPVVHVFIGCVHSCHVLCCVACSLCLLLIKAHHSATLSPRLIPSSPTLTHVCTQ